MDCPNCRSPRIQLLTSYVCNCNSTTRTYGTYTAYFSGARVGIHKNQAWWTLPRGTADQAHRDCYAARLKGVDSVVWVMESGSPIPLNQKFWFKLRAAQMPNEPMEPKHLPVVKVHIWEPS